MDEKFFEAATFESLWVVSFEALKKLVVYFGLSEFFCISSEETTKQILLMRSKFNFLYANECEFSFKYRYLKCWLCFCLFSDRKVISRHDFVAPLKFHLFKFHLFIYSLQLLFDEVLS